LGKEGRRAREEVRKEKRDGGNERRRLRRRV
jgi:hypothetical protein